jgi:hypothetical protein
VSRLGAYVAGFVTGAVLVAVARHPRGAWALVPELPRRLPEPLPGSAPAAHALESEPASAPSGPAAIPTPSTPSTPSTPAQLAPGVARAFAPLLGQLNARWPARSKASDGTLPSAAHHAANPNSDHERGDALDVTHDAVNGPDLDALASALLKDPRTSYVIWNRRIANPSVESGAWRPYARTTGPTDPHTTHLHLSVVHAKRDDVAAWDISAVPDRRAEA